VQSDGVLSIFGTNSFFKNGVACVPEANLPNWSQFRQISEYGQVDAIWRRRAIFYFYLVLAKLFLVLLSEKKWKFLIFSVFF
jgi:hypothetical protein